MTNRVDTLFHITNFANLQTLLIEGFKPSYAKEQLGDRDIIVPMISFSNVLLRDLGENEVLNYGEYGIGFSRSWAISKNINPVIYTYKDGEAQASLTNYLENVVLVSKLRDFKEQFEEWTKCKCGKLSSSLNITNTSEEAMNLVDFVSSNYNEELVEHLTNFANSIFSATKPFIYLTKPYQVENRNGDTFIAYNDREWRKTFIELDFQVEDTKEYDHWLNQKKPHFHEEKYRLTFDVSEISAILIKNEDERSDIIDALSQKFPKVEIENLIKGEKLFIDTKDKLIALGF